MKISKLFLVSILLLSIITIGAVSAAEDSNLTGTAIDEKVSDLEIAQDSALADDDDPIIVEIESKKELMVNEICNVDIIVPENTTGYIMHYLDEADEYDEAEYFDEASYISTSFTIRDFGQHTYYVKYFDGNKPDKVFSFPFSSTDYYFNVTPEDSDELIYGDDVYFWINIPSGVEGTLTVFINDKKYVFENDEYDEMPEDFKVTKDAFKFGANTLRATFAPSNQASQFKKKTIEYTFYTRGEIKAPYYVNYNTDAKITLLLPSDAVGTLTATIDDKKYSAEIVNGSASVAIPKLKMGNYEIFAKFEGNYKLENLDSYFQVKANIIAPKLMWINGTQEIVIEVSPEITGKITAFDYDETELGSADIINGKATIPLSLNQRYYDICLNYEGNDDIILDNVITEVIDECPEWNMTVDTKSTIKTYASIYISEIPQYMEIDNTFELYIDCEKINIKAGGNEIYFDASKLEKGMHTYELKFLGDGYYLPTSAKGTIEIDDIKVEYRPEFIIEGDDQSSSITVYMPNDTSGTLTFKLNGKIVASQKILPDKDSEYVYESIDIDEYDLKINKNNSFEISLKDSKYGSITKTGSIYVSYTIDASKELMYGDSNLQIYAPNDIDPSKITVEINGVKYKVTEASQDDYSEYYVKITEKLKIGNHIAVISYSGDNKYPALTKTSTFKVYAEIIIKDSEVTLILPDDAKGNLTVTVEGNEYANIRANGNVSVDMKKLHWGYYYIDAKYTGDDYEVFEESRTITVNPEFKKPEKITAGSAATVSIDLEKGISGTLNVWGGEIDETVYVVDGKASISLSKLPVGKNYLHAGFTHIYTDDEGYETEDYYADDFEIEVINPITAKDTTVIYSASGKYQANIKDINGNAVTSGKVTFYILDGKKQILKKEADIKNGVATLSYKITQGVKTYKIKTAYNKASVTKKLTVKHVVSLKTVKVKKSAKKVTVQANLAKVNGKYLAKKTVTFKFNGKTYKAKTNSKGVAKVTINKSVLSKLKVGKKITYQATYLKDTVKKTVKVLK